MARSWTPSQEAAMSIRGKTLLVSAAAGSGKTSVLTERIIRSLIDPDHPADLSSLLVVTFTRAAAAELKGRIASALTEALAQDPGNTHLSKQLLLLGSAQISTIDSFFQKLVRSNFEQLGLPATFRIADESENRSLAIETMEGLIEDFYQKYMVVNTISLERVTTNPFASALDHLLSNRSDGKLTELLLEFEESFASCPEGIERLRRFAEELRDGAERDFMKTSYGKRLREFLEELFTAYHNDLIRLKEDLAFDPDIEKKCSGLLSTDTAFCESILASLEEESYEALFRASKGFLVGRFPQIKNKPPQVSAYQNWRIAFRKVLSTKVFEMLAYSSEQIATQLQKTAELCDMLYALFSEYEQRVMTEKKQRGILNYNDIRTMLYRMLSNADGTESEFAKSLAAEYSAVYIDEYQDVDLLQDRIFALIGGNKRFMVGDIKQSIYGFRGSDPSIFASYRRDMPLYTDPSAEASDGVCVFMSDNFRCNRPIITFANHVCGFLFSACEKSVGYRPQDDLVCSKKPPEGVSEDQLEPVHVALFDAPNRRSNEASEEDSEGDSNSEEAVWVAAEISRLIREGHLDNGAPITPSDVAILVQTKKSGLVFMQALEELGIPASADAGTDFMHEPLMTDLLNLLRAIDNPYRDLPLTEFLLSPFGGFDLEELTRIRDASPETKALFDAMTDLPLDCDEQLLEKTSSVCSWLNELRNEASRLPADRFLRLLYLDERLVAYANDPILLFLYEQARIYQRSTWCGLFGFLNHIDRLLEGKPISADGLKKAESAVRIMTVHHSKGLEFPVVFLCAVGSGFNRADTRENLLFHRHVGCASKLYNPSTAGSSTSALRELLKLEIDTEQTEESIRTLYVALTRARERLYVTGTLRGKWENTLANASVVNRRNRYSILFCSSYLTWFLTTLNNCQNGEFPCTFQHISFGTVEKGQPIRSDVANSDGHGDAASLSPLVKHYANILQNRSAFSYPLSFLQGLPTKAAASKLRPNLLDLIQDEEDEDASIEVQIEMMRASSPEFTTLLNEKKKPTATDIGTATHAFLEFCDYTSLAENGIEAEIERLVNQRYIDANTARIIRREQLELLCKSNLMDWIKHAKKIYREQKFSIFVPFSKLTEDAELSRKLDGQDLFVQGSIDLLLQADDGKLILVDYKTDRISESERADCSLLIERMAQTHGTQLSCYREAVHELFGRYPDSTCIYSLPLGKALDISEKTVNSQSKFHSRKAVEFTMRNKRNLVWEKKKRRTKELKKKEKSGKKACLKSLRG